MDDIKEIENAKKKTIKQAKLTEFGKDADL